MRKRHVILGFLGAVLAGVAVVVAKKHRRQPVDSEVGGVVERFLRAAEFPIPASTKRRIQLGMKLVSADWPLNAEDVFDQAGVAHATVRLPNGQVLVFSQTDDGFRLDTVDSQPPAAQLNTANLTYRAFCEAEDPGAAPASQ